MNTREATQHPNVTGKWDALVTRNALGTVPFTFDFVARGETLTGSVSSVAGKHDIAQGRVVGDEITFVEPFEFDRMTYYVEYKGTIAGNEIQFTQEFNFETSYFTAYRAQ